MDETHALSCISLFRQDLGRLRFPFHMNDLDEEARPKGVFAESRET